MTISTTGTSGRLASVDDAGQLLGGVSRSTVYKLMTSGELASMRVAGRRMVLIESINQYVDRSVTR